MPERRRADPDALLALVRSESGSAAHPRGKLKIFFGATAGVGKTYAMLEAAQERHRAGADVAVGLVETHERRDTEALLAGLEILPRIPLEHRGVTLHEFDVDAALARHPQILLVDELAHTNTPGSRHEKRWQDVEEILDAGIDVYSTLNVQHVESLNDVVARITGVQVRETVPDSVLESADEVELIDLPAEELLDRLREGKVYLPAQAERAMERFFRKGNLIALRQLALLRTADRVDRQMELYRRAQAVAETWPVRDRLLVGVGPAPSSQRLIRATKRMADRLGAEWVAVFVETPAAEHWPQVDRDRVWESLRLAEQMGGKTVSLTGSSTADEILSYARAHNVTKLVVGKPTHSTWRDALGLSLHDRIVRGSGPIDVYVITGEEEPTAAAAVRTRAPPADRRRGYAWATAGVAIATMIARLLVPVLAPTNLVMIYLLAVVLVAVLFGRGPAALAAVLSVAAFDYFFVPPHFTFAVADTQFLVTFAVMLSVGLVIGTLTARLRDQGKAARQQAWRTAFLYDVSRDLGQTADVDAMVRAVLPRIEASVEGKVHVLLADAGNGLHPWSDSMAAGSPGAEGTAPGTAPVDPSEMGVLQWVQSNRRPAGMGTDTFATRTAVYLPLATGSRSFGVVVVQADDPDRLRAPEQLHLLETVSHQLAAAMERARLAEESQRVRELEEMDRLKSEFVAVASRELRTPLRSLARSLDHLRSSAGDVQADSDVTRCMHAAADDVNRLETIVNDLLDLSRVEAGRLQLSVHAVSPAALVERAVGAARDRTSERGTELTNDVAPGLPAVQADAARIHEVLANLLDNAVRYAGPDGHVTVSADLFGRFVQFSVADDGAGIPVQDQARIFDRFVRLDSTQRGGGVGLGLAIARELVRAHRGAIWVDSGPGPGSVFSFTLPVA